MRRRAGHRRPTASFGRSSLLLSLLLTVAGCAANVRSIVLASTTSLEDSGLLAVLLPAFERAHPGLHIRLIAVGTGQALELGRRGDADVLLVHSAPDEERFMAEGHGTLRQPVMENRFVIVGPADDPAGAARAADAVDALRSIAARGGSWISRGDSSGTHRVELQLRSKLPHDAARSLRVIEAGQGMAETLHIAVERRAYTLTDNATFAALRNRLDMHILVDGDPRLRNVYSVIVTRRGTAHADAERLAQWLRSEEARTLIANFDAARQRGVAPAGGQKESLFMPARTDTTDNG